MSSGSNSGGLMSSAGLVRYFDSEDRDAIAIDPKTRPFARPHRPVPMQAGVIAVQGTWPNTPPPSRTPRPPTASPRKWSRSGTRESSPDCDVLLMPGGESTTISRLIRREGIDEEIREHVASGKPVLATCAGLIVCSRDAKDDRVDALGLVNVSVGRSTPCSSVRRSSTTWGRRRSTRDRRRPPGRGSGRAGGRHRVPPGAHRRLADPRPRLFPRAGGGRVSDSDAENDENPEVPRRRPRRAVRHHRVAEGGAARGVVHRLAVHPRKGRERRLREDR